MKKFKLFALTALVAVIGFGFSFTSCNNEPEPEDNPWLQIVQVPQTAMVNHSWGDDSGNQYNLTVSIPQARSVYGSGAYVLILTDSSGNVKVSTGNATVSGNNYSFTPSTGSSFTMTITAESSGTITVTAESVSITFDGDTTPTTVTASGSGTTSTKPADNNGGSAGSLVGTWGMTEAGWEDWVSIDENGNTTTGREYVEHTVTLSFASNGKVESTNSSDGYSETINGTYTTSGNIITVIPTSVKIGNTTYNKAQYINYLKSEAGGEHSAEIAQEIANDMFAPASAIFSISGSSLTLSWEGESVTLTKQGGSAGSLVGTWGYSEWWVHPDLNGSDGTIGENVGHTLELFENGTYNYWWAYEESSFELSTGGSINLQAVKGNYTISGNVINLVPFAVFDGYNENFSISSWTHLEEVSKHPPESWRFSISGSTLKFMDTQGNVVKTFTKVF